jgi:hypothetical protein
LTRLRQAYGAAGHQNKNEPQMNPFGGARLRKDRRFDQGNRQALTDSLGYVEKRADLSDIAVVCLVSSVGGRRSDVGAVAHR